MAVLNKPNLIIMIKKIFVIGTLSASIILLAACETAPSNQQNQQILPGNNETQTAGSSVDVNNQLISGSEDLLNMAVSEGGEQLAAEISEADSSNYLGALSAKNPELCDQMENNEYIQLCKDAVNNEILIDKALTELDPNFCDRLIAEQADIDACKQKVETAISAADAKNKEITALQTQMSLSDEIVEEGNVSRCSELGEDYIQSCELDILLNRAFSENDITVCKQATSADTVTLCENKFRELLPEEQQAPESV